MRRITFFDESHVVSAGWLLWLTVVLSAMALVLALTTSATGTSAHYGSKTGSVTARMGKVDVYETVHDGLPGCVDAVLDKAEQVLGGHVLLADIEAVRIRSHGMWEMSDGPRGHGD
jgi:hypothetical protein